MSEGERKGSLSSTNAKQNTSPPTSPTLEGFAAEDNEDLEKLAGDLLRDPASQRFPVGAVKDYNQLPTYPLRPSYKEFHFFLRPASRPVVFNGCPDNPYNPASVPIYQTASFRQPGSTEFGAYDYTRSGNPTRTALEKQIAMLEYAHAAFCFTTGMAALSCVTRLLSTGDTIMITADIYGGMHRLVSRVTSLYGIKVVFIETWDLDHVRRAFEEHDRVRMVHIETPSNPLMRITDIRALADICHQNDCYLSVDSTMMTPYLSQPLNHGADIVVHSLTKFFGGHSDTMGGVVAVAMESVAKKIAFFQNAEGTGLAPFDCWLFLRGIKTMAIRVERAQENAIDVANFLSRQGIVKKLYYAGLEPKQHEMLSNKQAAKAFKIHMGQAKGGGSIISFTTGSAELSRRIIDSLRLFKLTVSFGSCNSLCEMPAYLSHASIPSEQRTLPEDLVRLSVGIEDVNDLIEDLGHAFSIAQSSDFKTVLMEKEKQEPSTLHHVRTKPELPLPEPGKFNDVQHKSLASKNKQKQELLIGSTDLFSLGLVFLVGGLTGVMSSVVLFLRKTS